MAVQLLVQVVLPQFTTKFVVVTEETTFVGLFTAPDCVSITVGAELYAVAKLFVAVPSELETTVPV